MDRLTRLRTPLAVVALAALTLVAAARVVLGLSQLVGVGGSTAVAAARLAPNPSDGTLTVLVAALVASCSLAPVVGVRRRLAVWGAVLAAVSLLASVAALALTDLQVAGWNAVWLVPDLVVPALVGVGLVALARGPRDRSVPAVERGAVREPAEQEAAVPPDPELQPAWTPDVAAGAVWRTAGEAASGAPAAGWGSAEGSAWSVPPVASVPPEPLVPAPWSRPAQAPPTGSHDGAGQVGRRPDDWSDEQRPGDQQRS